MNKESLSYIVGELLELPRNRRHGEAYRAVQAIFKVISKALNNGESVSVKGFGIFRRYTKPRTRSKVCYFYGSMGKYREVVDIPARTRIIFKPSKVLLRMLNESQT